MISFRFDKATAQRILDAVANGKPIEPPDHGKWTRDEMLLLAGALHFVALSQGPTVLPGEDVTEAEFLRDLDDAITLYSKLTMAVADGEYDASGFAPSCNAMLQRRGGVVKTIGVLVGMPPPGSAFWEELGGTPGHFEVN